MPAPRRPLRRPAACPPHDSSPSCHPLTTDHRPLQFWASPNPHPSTLSPCHLSAAPPRPALLTPRRTPMPSFAASRLASPPPGGAVPGPESLATIPGGKHRRRAGGHPRTPHPLPYTPPSPLTPQFPCRSPALPPHPNPQIPKIPPNPRPKGCSSYLGWEWSGREFMTAVAEIVCRPSVGRHWAGTRPAPTVVARGFEHRSLSHPFDLSTTAGHTERGVAGGSPRNAPNIMPRWRRVAGVLSMPPVAHPRRAAKPSAVTTVEADLVPAHSHPKNWTAPKSG